jgi:hypothetical protein
MHGRPWTQADDELVLSLPPAEAAKRIGRSVQSVYHRRHALRAGASKRPWTEAEDRLLMRLPFEVAIRYIKRSPWAIDQRRRKLGLENDRPTLQ